MIAFLLFGAWTAPLAGQDVDPSTPRDVADKDKQPGLQAGGVEIRVTVPGKTEILVRGNDSDDPRDAPPPTPIGEEICPSGDVRGQLEPVQGVWQDDPTFADKPGKRIVRLNPVLWHAELPMVTNRRTMLFGVEKAMGAEPRRDEIFIKGEATGTERVPVRFRFTLQQSGKSSVIHESEIVGEIPIGGPCRPDAVLPFEASLDVTEGIPTPLGAAFFFEDGPYVIEAELVKEDGGSTGLKASVIGESVSTHAPSVAFRAIAILPATLEAGRRAKLEETTEDLARRSSYFMPDLLPVASEPMKTRAFPLRDHTGLFDQFARPGRKPRVTELVERLGPDAVEKYLNEMVREEIIRSLDIGGLMNGWDRVVVVTTHGDLALLWQGSLLEDARIAGFAVSNKLVFVLGEPAPHPSTVTHEIIHTLPFAFAEEVMLEECDRDYHNKLDHIAHGHQLTYEVTPTSVRRDGSDPVMGPMNITWVTQCSYRHALEYLRGGAIDPRVLLVQGFVARDAGRTAGALLPFYDLDGIEDLPMDGKGSWSVVLRNGAGEVLARHAWEPRWRIPDVPVERRVVSFAFRILRPDGLERVDLVGPDGVADSVALSASDPVVSIVTPADGATAPVEQGAVGIEWRGTDPDGDPLLYTVLYSSDGGASWDDVAIETEASSIDVPIDAEAPADAHRVLVRATDGGRSSDAMVAFRPAR